jgi:hypothetical protein
MLSQFTVYDIPDIQNPNTRLALVKTKPRSFTTKTPDITVLLLSCTLSCFALSFCLLSACDAEDPLREQDVTDAADISGLESADLIIPDAELSGSPCTTEQRPIVFVHGFIGGGDNFAQQSMRFASNGHCLEQIYAFDWNSLDTGANHEAALDAFIDNVLQETGATQIDLAGHSAGGGLGYEFLSDAQRAAKVSHYAHIASFYADMPAGPDGEIPTLNLWSEDDMAVTDGQDIPGATNVMLSDVDHFAVATSSPSFEALYEHFNDGTSPETSDISVQDEVVLGGRVLSFGENFPQEEALIQIFTLDQSTGFRQTEDPVAEFTSDSSGYWGPFIWEADIHFEFRVETSSSPYPVHYYFEPKSHSNHLLYLRTLPGSGSLVSLLLSGIPWDEDASLVVTYNANNAVIAGRDSLFVNGLEITTEALASPEYTAIAFFFYDENNNQETDGSAIGIFSSFGQFVAGVDMFTPAGLNETVEANYNDRTLRAANWPSESEGGIIFVFD